jgi:WD40 repeat protein
MEAFLNFLEKVLIWFFAVLFAVILAYGLMRYNRHQASESDPWIRAERDGTAEAYMKFLKSCDACSQKEVAQKKLDDLQKSQGLVSRLSAVGITGRDGITRPVFSSDGHLVLAMGGSLPRFWNAESGVQDSLGETIFAKLGKTMLNSVDISPDGRNLVGGGPGRQSGTLVSWDLSLGSRVGLQEVDGFDVRYVQYSIDGAWVGWMGDGPIGIWNPLARTFLRATHAGVQSLAFRTGSEGRQELLTVAGKELMVWELEHLDPVKRVRIDSDRNLLGLSRDGKVLLYSDVTALEIWDSASEKMVALIRDLKGSVESFCSVPGASYLVVGTSEGSVFIIDPAQPEIALGSVEAHEGPIEGLSCSSTGQFVTTSWDSAKVWSLAKIMRESDSLKESRGSRGNREAVH